MKPTTPELEFAKYFKTAMAGSLPALSPKVPRLRVSGFPFCGLRAAYERMADIKPDPENTTSMEYYTSVGTSAHEVFQRSLGVRGRIYGDWKCRDEKCTGTRRFSRKSTCPKCGKEMEYVEFEVTAFRHVSGHTDGLYLDLMKRNWLIDYKTSSMRVLNYQKSNPTLPYRKNVQQIESYVPMMEHQYNIDVAGWMLGYVPRDDPKTICVKGCAMSQKKKDAVWQKIKLYDDQYEEVLNLNSLSQLRYLRDTKFCRNYDHYLRDMKGFKACPLEGVCFTSHLSRVLRQDFDLYRDSENCK